MIFNLFKSKPTLKELIPNGFVDIHSHVLPGVDDGAKDINESLSLISQMKEMGFSKIIGTPHTYQGLYDNTNESIKGSFDLLKKNLNEDVDLDYASEYMIDRSLLERIEERSLLTLKDNYVLVEMSFISAPIELYEILFQLQLNNYIPVLAHPERYLFIDHNEFHKLHKIGCKLQLNLLSITGYYGKEVMSISDWLLSKKLINFVGSDIHSQRHINSMKEVVKIRNIDLLKKAIESNCMFK
ncbi:MAG: tyrosine-protein phosphatase [Flavobacteriaceae bacterium]